ncbi:MAG: serine protease [Patescibacteria group bacterium]
MRHINYLLLVAMLFFATAGLTCTHPPDSRSAQRLPQCIYLPRAPEEPLEDPFAMDNDGLTDEERIELISRGVASTVHLQVRRYSRADGYTFFSGSGVFITNHHVLTAEHVVHRSDDRYAILRRLVSDTLSIGVLRRERIEVLRTDEDHDVALLRIFSPPELAEPMPIARNWEPQVNELLWQFGERTGWSRGRVVRQVPNNISEAREIRGMVQMRMLGQGGDSGGPVMNTRGELVGLILRGTAEEGRQFFVRIDVAMRALDLHI